MTGEPDFFDLPTVGTYAILLVFLAILVGSVALLLARRGE
jgi:hypothetical protein